jgi:hypothetical protein
LGFSVSYSEWSIKPGESIVERIHADLERIQTLLVLVSKRSVESEWVQHELDVAVMDTLAGHQVRVVPVLLEDCRIPTALRQIRYVDMRGSFGAGFIALVELLNDQNAGSLRE